MEEVIELEEAIAQFPAYHFQFGMGASLKKLVIERKLNTSDIEKVSEYSATDISSEFLKQLNIVKQIKSEEVENFILMLNALYFNLNAEISDFDYELELASSGNAEYYNDLLLNKDKVGEDLSVINFFSSSFYTNQYIERFRLESIELIRDLEKMDTYKKEELHSEMNEILEEAVTGSNDFSGHEGEMGNTTNAALRRIDQNFIVLKEQRYVDLEIKIKEMRLL